MERKYGEYIKHHRISSGFKSQRQLAEKSGVSSATISRIESEIQKPNPETLKELAPHLTSTSLVELMVVCGYWEEDDLLEDNFSVKETKAPYSSSEHEDEMIQKVNLSDDDLLKEFELIVDGRSLTKEEAKGIIAYVRSLRQI